MNQKYSPEMRERALRMLDEGPLKVWLTSGFMPPV